MAHRPKTKTVKPRKSPPTARSKQETTASKQPTQPKASSAPGEIRRIDQLIWAAVLLLIYVTVGTWGHFDFTNMMGYYDLFADALLDGQLYIDIRPEQGYIHDMIPFEGHYYIQWGPFPGIFHAAAKLVGTPLTDRVACILSAWLTSLIFLAIMLHLRRRFFPEMSKASCRWFFYAFALATPTVIIALRGTVYHESIGIGALSILASFYALLRSLETDGLRWPATAGALIGLAMLTRVTLVLYAPAMFIFLAIALYGRRSSVGKFVGVLAAFSVPVFAAGGIQMLYNAARFGSPWDYGNNYLVDATGQAPFALSRVPENIKHYLLALPTVSNDFPWIEHVGWMPLVETLRAEDVSSALARLSICLVRLGRLPLGQVRVRSS